MKKIYFYLFTAIIILNAGCTKEPTTIRIVRHPIIQFSTDSATWVANSYNFLARSRVIEYPANSAVAQLYTRNMLQADGIDSRGNSLQLILSFDGTDDTNLMGTYFPRYTTSKGLKAVQLFNLTTGNLAAYGLCDSVSSVLQITKQSLSERLVTGTFSAVVCNTKDTTRKINIKNGTFTDINY